MIPNSTQNNLIQDCINLNRKRQKELYDLFAPSMYTICMRYAKNQMDTEDILQNGFIKLFNNLHKFRGDGSFEGWVRRIFVNSAIELLREKRNHIPLDLLAEPLVPVSVNLPLNNLYYKDLLKTTTLLSNGYQTIFYLYAIEGFSHKEIAKFIGISESTSKSQYSRAKAILRNVIINKKDNKAKASYAA